jgi:hypothetical protein
MIVEDPVVDTPSSDNGECVGSDQIWKEDLERLSASWRAESAVAREKAERERERWRLFREQEAVAARSQTNPEKRESDWEDIASPFKAEKRHADINLSPGEVDAERFLAPREAAAAVSDAPPRQGELCLADVRDLVTGEVNQQQFADTDVSDLAVSVQLSNPYTFKFPLQRSTLPQDNITRLQSNIDDQTLSGSRTWEDVPSLDSSFPSFSIHDHSPPASGPRNRPRYQQPPEPPLATLSIFDRSLSRRARTLAIISSIAINFFLPFVNGVMLGFGEIFAKNIIGYFGWEIPGTGLGIRASLRRKRD